LLQGLDIVLIPDRYNAGETKWIIGKMTAFAGSRTHSTIAALSMCVPTLSFAYSIKSMGINRDMFGHEKFCITKDDCQAALVAEKIKDLLTEGASIREQLKIIVPEFQRKALSAGEKLLEVCD
jgi:polysaccharide pyruvyl transferase WcaK-like protein